MKTLWERLRSDVKEKILWEKKRYPNLMRDMIKNLTENYFVTDIPVSQAVEIMDFYTGKAYIEFRIVNFYTLFETNLK